MANEDAAPSPKKKVRWGRIFGFMLLLVLLGAGLYGASWLNARRYYLVVGPTDVRVGRGRMLPMGHDPFVPTEPTQRKAYRTFPLPGGLTVERGERSFFDRVELDQQLYDLLVRSLEHTLAANNARTPELSVAYLEQLRALPGLNVEQRGRVDALGQQAIFVEAKALEAQAVAALQQAIEKFEVSAKGGAPVATEARARAAALTALLQRLRGEAVLLVPPPAPAATSTIGAAAP